MIEGVMISEMDEAVAVSGDDIIPVVQNNLNKTVTVTKIVDFLSTHNLNGVDASAGDQVFALPDKGQCIVVKTDETAYEVIVQPSVVGHTINGEASYRIGVKGEAKKFALLGTTWYLI